MNEPECQYLHAFYEDDWARCPSPEPPRYYKLTAKDGTCSNGWYCDIAAEEVEDEGYTLELAQHPNLGVVL